MRKHSIVAVHDGLGTNSVIQFQGDQDTMDDRLLIAYQESAVVSRLSQSFRSQLLQDSFKVAYQHERVSERLSGPRRTGQPGRTFLVELLYGRPSQSGQILLHLKADLRL